MRPSVETLSDAAWSRVERDVFSYLDALDRVEPARAASPNAARRWWWVALPAISAIAIAIVILRGPVAPPRVASDVEWSRVVTGAAPSDVMFADADIAVDADSAVVLQREVVRPVVWLEHGAAWFSVAPRLGREPFVVLAGDTIVRVIGTRFRVARYAEHTLVTVERGVVDVQYRGDIVHLIAGQTWSSPQPTPSTPKLAPSTPSIAPAAPKATTAPARHDPSETDQQRYESFAQLEASQPDVAIRGYLELSQGSSKWAALALYSAGRLAADRKDPRAATFLTIYLRRFPAGANVADVTYLLDRLQGASR
ncbi:MAG TPA: FecR family protein [Kofleriaceae bacterium]|jgi:hypothetical protein